MKNDTLTIALSNAINTFTVQNSQLGNLIRTELSIYDPERSSQTVEEYFKEHHVLASDQLIGPMNPEEKIYFSIALTLKQKVGPIKHFLDKNDDTHEEYSKKQDELLDFQFAAKLLHFHLQKSIRTRLKDLVGAKYLKYREGYQIVIPISRR